MKVTIKDIARIAGVSHSTVSRCLNDSSLISDETKEKIKKIACDVGFEFNASARSLSTKKTSTIGVMIAEIFNEFSAGLFFGALMKHVLDNLEKYSYDTILKFQHNKITKESNVKKLINMNKVDGMLITFTEMKPEDIEFIRKVKFPHVYLHAKPRYFDISKDNYFLADHFKGGYLAAEHLIKRGYKKIITITAMIEEWEFQERINGYKKALDNAGIIYNDNDIYVGDITFKYGENFVLEHRELFKEKIGIFVQTDLMAMGVIEGLKKIGKKVPEDVGIVGYDDLEIGSYAYPKLTTIHQPVEEMAKMASERLIDIINGLGGEVVQEIVAPRLIVRES